MVQLLQMTQIIMQLVLKKINLLRSRWIDQEVPQILWGEERVDNNCV